MSNSSSNVDVSEVMKITQCMKLDHFTYSVSDIDETGMYIVSVHDERTDYTIRTAIPDHGRQSASLMAFAGARYSRSSDTAEDIFKEINESGKSAQEKLANIFRNYGHASVADMANLFLYIENIPKHYEARFFNETSIGGGQGRSSRYQDFGNGQPVELGHYFPSSTKDSNYEEINTRFTDIQSKTRDLFNAWKEVLTPRYIELYEVNTDDKQQLSALTARVLDTARAFLTSGLSTRTSIAWVTNAREWARLIGVFKGSKDLHLNYLAEQIEVLLAPDHDIAQKLGYVPEAPDLIKYTQADEKSRSVREGVREFLKNTGFEEYIETLKLNRDNLENVRISMKKLQARVISEYSGASFKAVIQIMLHEYPSVGYEICQSFLYSLSEEDVQTLGKIVFDNFDHHEQMGVAYRTNQLSYEIDLSNSEAIDLNRHRAWGRFSPLWNAEETAIGCLENGYILPLYISDVPEMSDLKEKFIVDMEAVYSDITSLVIDMSSKEWFNESIVPQMLPLAHNARLFMHGSIKEVSYMTKLRVRPGGQINYREIAWQMAQYTAIGDPLLAAIEIKDQPDPNSKSEFLDRS
jgi:thymidylate synthase ThyX